MSVQACCKLLHDGEAAGATPEAVMRARFSAYVKKAVNYVVDTTHPDNPAYEGSRSPDGELRSTLREDVVATADKVAFQRLSVKGSEEGSTEDEGFVTFSVLFRVVGQVALMKGPMQRQQETSRFVKCDGQWLYRDAETLKITMA